MSHEEFAAFLRRCSEEVAKWPEWKRNVLGKLNLNTPLDPIPSDDEPVDDEDDPTVFED